MRFPVAKATTVPPAMSILCLSEDTLAATVTAAATLGRAASYDGPVPMLPDSVTPVATGDVAGSEVLP